MRLWVESLEERAVPAAFTMGNLVVERIGGDASFGAGGSALTNAATPVFLDEITINTGQTAPVQTIAMPTSDSGSNQTLTDSGTATSNGYLTRSANGEYLVVSGYDAAVGTASVANSNPATVNRTIGRVWFDGSVDTSTTFNNGPNNNFRSVTTIDGTRYWVGLSGNATLMGIGTVAHGGTALDNIFNGNARNTLIAGNRLFVSAGATAGFGSVGIHVMDAGNPPPTGSATNTLLSSTNTSGTGTPSPYSFVFFDLNSNNFDGTGFDTLYVADDRAATSGGGLQRWDFDGSAWTRQFTINTPIRGLTGYRDGNDVVLFATTIETSANKVVKLIDTLSGNAGATFETLITAPANTVFRGVALAPEVPKVVSVTRADANPTSATSVNYTVTFTHSVTGVNAADFTITQGGGISGATITSVSGSGTTWTVTVGGYSGTGTIKLNLVDDDSIKNSLGAPLGGTGTSGTGNGSFTGGDDQTYTITAGDTTPPVVDSIVRADGNPTNAASVQFTVTFSENVTGVDASDFTLTTSGVSGASITSVTGTGATRTVTVNTGTGSGTIRLDVVDDDTIVDGAGNKLGGTGAGNGDFTTGEVYTIDKTAPVVVSIVRADGNPTNAASVQFTVTFSESVTG
ncbi:MAG: hypothetical protein NZO58_01820, partial [Gemmataceae bacterium]|nr:hypothetical protein [Gemmataceae bacterium]